MSILKLNSSVCVMLVVLVMVMASSQLAMADTKTLVCKWNGGDTTPLVTIDLNEAQGTATAEAPLKSLNIFSPSAPV